MFKKVFATFMVAAMMATSFNADGLFDSYQVSAATILPDSTIKSIPYFNSEHNFIRYMDNSDTDEYKPIVEEEFVDDWKQDGGVHTYKATVDGTLMWYTIAPGGHVEGLFYEDFALTKDLGRDNGDSNRRECKSIEIKKGKTYYFRQARWNGSGEPVKGSTYMGIIPKSSSVATLNVNTKYNEKDNVAVKEFSSYDDYQSNYETALTSELYVKEEWKGSSEVKSFTVKKPGWLLVYAMQSYNHVTMKLFTDKNLMINIGQFSYDVNTDTKEPDKIWLDAGTYYYRADRWNGFEDKDLNSPLKTYLGFVPADKYIKASAAVLSKDKKSATVKFTKTVSGNIRVMSGAYAPYKISDDYWDINNRTNMLQGNTFVAKANKYYTARFEDVKSGLNFMIIFSVNGIISKQNNAANVKIGKAKIKKAKNVKGKKIKLTLKKVKNATGYEVQYATNKKFKKAKTTKIKKLKVTLKKLKKKKKYFIRVRAFNKTTKGAWSKVKKVKVKK